MLPFSTGRHRPCEKCRIVSNYKGHVKVIYTILPFFSGRRRPAFFNLPVAKCAIRRGFAIARGISLLQALENDTIGNPPHRLTLFNLPLTHLGLRCYTCDTDGRGQDCIENPDKYSQNDCTEGKDYCFTYRREDMNEGGEAST